MSVKVSGDNIIFPDNSTQATAASALNNRLIDAGFTINQRTYVSGTALAAGVYAHDRWKAGASGGTYTFTQGSLGVPITVTITAGSIMQIIEGCNVPEGGTYTLSWQGTAQARVNGGSYSASPLVVTGLTAGANVTVEFNTGTLLKPKFEAGAVASSFDYRPYGTELALCQRYYTQFSNVSTDSLSQTGTCPNTTSGYCGVAFPIQMRSVPTFSYTSLSNIQAYTFGGSNGTISTLALNAANPSGAMMLANFSNTVSNGVGFYLRGNGASSSIQFSAEL